MRLDGWTALRFAPLLAVAAGVWWWQSSQTFDESNSKGAEVSVSPAQPAVETSTLSPDVDDVSDIVRRLQLAELSGRLDLMAGLLARANALAPSHPDVLFYRAYYALSEEHVESAQQAYQLARDAAIDDRRLTQLKSYLDSQTEKRQQLQQAQILATAGRLDEALSLYDDLYPAGMPTLRLQLDITRLRGRAGQAWEQTRRQLESLNQRYPRFPDIELALANHYARRGATEAQAWALYRKLAEGPGLGRRAAGDWLQQLAARDPTPSILDDYALLARRYPRDLAVQQALQRALTARDEERERLRDPHYRARKRGIAQLDVGDNVAAERSLRFALQGRPDDELVLGNLGLALIRLGRQDEAYPLLERALQVNRDPDLRSKWRTLSATAAFWGGLKEVSKLVDVGRFTAAQARLDQLYQLQPDNPGLWVAYAGWAEAQGRSADALDYYRQALRRDAESSSALRGSFRLREQAAGRVAALAWLESLTANQRRILAPQRDAIELAMHLAELEALAVNADANPEQVVDRAKALLAATQQGATLSPWQRRDLAMTLREAGEPEWADRLMAGWAEADGPGGEDAPTPTPNNEMLFAYALYLSSSGELPAARDVLSRVPEAERSAAMTRSLTRWQIDLAFDHLSVPREGSLTGAQRRQLDQLEQRYVDEEEAQLRIAEIWLAAGEQERAGAVIDGLTPADDWPLQTNLDYGNALIDLSRFRQFELWFLGLDRRDVSAAEQAAFTELRSRHQFNRARASEAAGKTLLAYSFYHQVGQRPGPHRVPALLGVLRTSQAAGNPDANPQSLATLSGLLPSLSAVELVSLAEEADRMGRPELQLEALRALGDKPNAPAYVLRNGVLQAESAAQWQLAEQLTVQAMRTHLAEQHADTDTEKLYQQLGNDWLSNSLRASVDRQRARVDGHVKVALDLSERESREQRWQVPVELKLPIPSLSGHLIARLDVVDVHSGDVNYLQANNAGNGVNRLPFSARDRGVALGVGWQSENWWFDLGTTPIGFQEETWVGGVGVNGSLLGLGWSAVLSRRPEMGTTLSYAGMAVPATARNRPGAEWGGVVRSGAKLGFSLDRGRALGAWWSLQYHQLTGQKVEDNDRLAALGGVYWRVVNRDELQWRLGVNVLHMQYDKNLEEFTLGHGGYYSPQQYLSLSLPVRVFGRWRDDWSYLLGASVSRSQKKEDAPLGLPGQSSDGGGNGFSVEAAIEKRIAAKWYIGVAGDIQRADFYEPNHLSLYLRYTFQDRWSPIPTPPESPILYGAFD